MKFNPKSPPLSGLPTNCKQTTLKKNSFTTEKRMNRLSLFEEVTITLAEACAKIAKSLIDRERSFNFSIQTREFKVSLSLTL